MRKWKKINGFLILFIAFFSACAGFSSWNLNPSIPKGFDINIDNSKNKVAYFKDGNTKREFTTVAGALKAAADQKRETLVVVNPDATGNVSITDCTIADKVTLIINYKAVENYKSPSDKAFVNDYTGDKDGGLFGDTAGSTSKIKLSGARKIESGGSLIIGGETGQYNISLQGGTRGSCAELDFVEGGSIDCHGKIISYGFIHDYLEGTRGENEAAITIHDGGSVAEPLTIYTWPGGSSASGLKDKRIFPCNVFDLINIRPPMKFEYGSTFTGKGKVYTAGIPFLHIGAGYYNAEASIIARDNQEGFLQLQNGKDANNGTGISGSVLFDANDADIKKTSYDYTSHKAKIKTAGDFSFSGVAVKVGASLDTKEGYLPISGIFDIEVGKGFGEVKYPTKLLPGASLKIGEGAYFKLDNNFIAYQSVENSEGYKRWNYSFSSPATIQNSGTREICSGFDGQIFAKNRNGKMIVGSGYSNVSDCRDRDTTATIGAQGNEHNSVFAFYNGANRNRLAQRYAIDGTTSYISKGNENAVANRTYTSSATSDGKYGWTYNNEYKSYPIVIDTNGNDSAVDTNGQKYIENYGSGTVVLSNLTSKDPDKTFAGFYYDQACTKALKTENDSYIVELSVAVGYVNNGILTIYSKWITAGLITVNQYKGQNDLTTTQSSLTSGKTYHLSDFNITGNDSRPMKKVDNVSRTEFVFQNWIIYDASDAKKSNKLASDGSFTPESGKSYNLEPVFKTNYYLYRSVEEKSWDSWGTTYYMMHNFKVSGSDTPQDVSEKNKMFSAISDEDSKHSTTYTSGWISLNATISFERESHTLAGGGPNYVHIFIGSNETLQAEGLPRKNKTVVISLSQYFNDCFVNGNGPIKITATEQHKSSNVQTI